MTYESVINQVKNSPASFLDKISEYINFLNFTELKNSERNNQKILELYPKELSEKEISVRDSAGILSQFANPKLWEKEKSAWAEAMVEKYDLHWC